MAVINTRERTFLTLAFNAESRAVYSKFRETLRPALADLFFYDFREERETPHVTLASFFKNRAKWKAKTRKADQEYKDKIESRFESLVTRPWLNNRIVIGQSFYSAEGYLASRRDVAVIYTNGAVNRLVEDAFDKGKSDEWVNAPVRAGIRKFPYAALPFNR